MTIKKIKISCFIHSLTHPFILSLIHPVIVTQPSPSQRDLYRFLYLIQELSSPSPWPPQHPRSTAVFILPTKRITTYHVYCQLSLLIHHCTQQEPRDFWCLLCISSSSFEQHLGQRWICASIIIYWGHEFLSWLSHLLNFWPPSQVHTGQFKRHWIAHKIGFFFLPLYFSNEKT